MQSERNFNNNAVWSASRHTQTNLGVVAGDGILVELVGVVIQRLVAAFRGGHCCTELGCVAARRVRRATLVAAKHTKKNPKPNAAGLGRIFGSQTLSKPTKASVKRESKS